MGGFVGYKEMLTVLAFIERQSRLRSDSGVKALMSSVLAFAEAYFTRPDAAINTLMTLRDRVPAFLQNKCGEHVEKVIGPERLAVLENYLVLRAAEEEAKKFRNNFIFSSALIFEVHHDLFNPNLAGEETVSITSP